MRRGLVNPKIWNLKKSSLPWSKSGGVRSRANDRPDSCTDWSKSREKRPDWTSWRLSARGIGNLRASYSPSRWGPKSAPWQVAVNWAEMSRPDLTMNACYKWKRACSKWASGDLCKDGHKFKIHLKPNIGHHFPDKTIGIRKIVHSIIDHQIGASSVRILPEISASRPRITGIRSRPGASSGNMVSSCSSSNSSVWAKASFISWCSSHSAGGGFLSRFLKSARKWPIR